MNTPNKLWTWAWNRGLTWTILYSIREAILRTNAAVMLWLEGRISTIERRKLIFGLSTLSNEGNTSAENARIWGKHDWSRFGEEWTDDAQAFAGKTPAEWKASLVHSVIEPYVTPGLVILEIGPGGGRWTEHLISHGSRLILADITQQCLDICKGRFGDKAEYLLVTGSPPLAGIANASVDLVWSYDAFVHINPADTQAYVNDFSRIMRKGALGVIHHPGEYESYARRIFAFRSNVDSTMFKKFVESSGLTVVNQDRSLPHLPGDCITIFKK